MNADKIDHLLSWVYWSLVIAVLGAELIYMVPPLRAAAKRGAEDLRYRWRRAAWESKMAGLPEWEREALIVRGSIPPEEPKILLPPDLLG